MFDLIEEALELAAARFNKKKKQNYEWKTSTYSWGSGKMLEILEVWMCSIPLDILSMEV